MKLSTLFSIFAVVSLLFGLSLLIFPDMVMNLLGIASLDDLAAMLLRFIGGVALSLGLMSWSLRNADASQARDGVVLGLSLGNAICALILIWSALSGIFNALIWVEAAIFALFAIAFFLAGRMSLNSA